MVRPPTPTVGAPAAPAIALRVLGPVTVIRSADGARVATSPRLAALLAYVAIAEPRGPQSRDVLAALLWPEAADEERARRSLRNALHELRRACGADVIASVGKHQVRLDAALVDCDLDRLEARLAAGDASGAVALYGELLDGLHVRGADGFERWHDAARRALRGRLTMAVQRAAARCTAGTPPEEAREVLSLLDAARRIDPDDERLLRTQLELQARHGDLSAARRTFRAHAERIAREEGAVPDAETVALMARLAATAAAPAVATIGLVPLAADEADASSTEFSRALDDGVRRRLTREPGVRVVARAALPRGDDATLDRWRALGVDLVVTGTITREREEVALRVEVMRVRDGVAIRDLRHRAPMHALFAVEGVVAAAILPSDGARTETPPLPVPQAPRDAEAHLLCLRGQWHFLRAAHVGGNADDLERSRDAFEQALARDPAHGAAYAGLSNYFAVCAARGIRAPFEAAFGQAIAHSHRALELDASLAVPHVHFGVRALYLERDWTTAHREFAEAVRLDPGYAEARRFLGIVQRTLGDGRAGLAELQEAVRLEPQTPLFRNSLADALLAEGAIESAVTELEIALALDPGYRAAAERLTRCHERRGDWAAAVVARRRHGAAEADRFAAALVQHGPAGYRAERRRELEEGVSRVRARLSTSTERAPADRFVPPELTLAVALAELERWEEAWAVEASMPAGARPWFASHPALAPLAARRASRKQR